VTKALVLSGDGINSDKELALALEAVGFKTDFALLNDLAAVKLADYDLLAIAGGFSYADDLGSGKVAALKIKKIWQQEIKDFIAAKKLILGICNGFQVLVQMGLLPDESKQAALSFNDTQEFINKWVEVKINPKVKSPWFTDKQKQTFYLPIRHAEGKFITKTAVRPEQIALTYIANPNGSMHDIAGLVDKEGLVFGLMPHPEAAYEDFQIPLKDKTPYAKEIFKNAYNYLRSKNL